MEQTVVSVAEARAMTRLGTTKLYELFNDGTIETVHLGRRRLVKVRSIRKLLGETA